MKAFFARLKCWRHGHDWQLHTRFHSDDELAILCLTGTLGGHSGYWHRDIRGVNCQGIRIYGYVCHRCGKQRHASKEAVDHAYDNGVTIHRD